MKVINWVWIGIAGLTCFVGVGILGNSDGVWQETEGIIVLCTGLVLAALASLIQNPTRRNEPVDKEAKRMWSWLWGSGTKKN